MRPIAAILASDKYQRESVRQIMLAQGFEVNAADRMDELFRSVPAVNPDLIVMASSRKVPDGGLESARRIRRYEPRTPIIVIGTKGLADELDNSLGKIFYLKFPFAMEELTAIIKRALPFCTAESDDRLGSMDSDLGSDERMVGRSPQISRVTDSLRKIAATDCTVLITGETGTGKELAAKFIHQHSPRAQQPFVVINSAAIPDTLLESELFGHERGAFTGAVTKQEGGILSANQGTVFFDEIGDMTPFAQAKILRTIENKEVRAVGGKRNVPIDIRFIAATNRNLEELISEGKFRADLYFRLNVARVLLPPLRERQGDVVLLLEYFRRFFNRQYNKRVEGFTKEALATLRVYDWPGNIRELKNLVESTFIYASREVSINDFPESFCEHLRKSGNFGERARLLTALFETNWNKAKAAQRLNWSRMTLYRKMEKYGVDPAFHEETQANQFAYQA